MIDIRNEQEPATFEAATALLRTTPQPADIIAKLDALRKKTPKEWIPYFDDFYEGAFAGSEKPPR